MTALAPWVADDVPDQSGRVVLVTGANRGIGLEIARVLAAQGATVVLGCRDCDSADRAAQAIQLTAKGAVETLDLDLADLTAVARAADELSVRHGRLDVLINNAAVLATPLSRTAQGVELQFGVNHLAHFALTLHLLPLTRDIPGSRVVTVTSHAHRTGRLDPDRLGQAPPYSAWGAYADSKLANLLFARELQRRLVRAGWSTSSLAVHPGAVRTRLGDEPAPGVLNTLIHLVRPVQSRLFARPPSIGAMPALRAATDPSVSGGTYLGPAGVGGRRTVAAVSPGKHALDDDLACRLWDASLRLGSLADPLVEVV